jgi:hypothetical protein
MPVAVASRRDRHSLLNILFGPQRKSALLPGLGKFEIIASRTARQNFASMRSISSRRQLPMRASLARSNAAMSTGRRLRNLPA